MMNFSGKVVLVYLEEDNIQRAYFRIRPLLTQDGPVDKQMVAEYPDDGYLRIVPDKNEQHTFKERMRTLCGLCVLNLSQLPPEINKIRTNKNYNPTRGENNQYIVYSDAVQAMPKDAFYQVVPEDQLSNALTPLVFTRNGANIQGPFDSTTHQCAGDVQQLPPDSSCIYTVTLPDDRELLFYCPRTETPPQEAPEEEAAADETPAEVKEEQPAPDKTPAEPAKPASPWKQQLDAIMAGEKKPAKEEAPAAKTPEHAPQQPKKPDMQNALAHIQAMNGELNVSSRLKDDSKPFQLAQPAPASQTLGGTKLYQPASVKKPNNPKAHNSLAETVDMQRNPNRYETRYEAPGAVIPANAPMNDLSNPVECFRHTLQKVWMTPDTHRQVVDSLMGMHGMRQALTKALCEGKNDLTIAAMHSQLQELEAERLMTLMQLDDVKANKQKLKDEVMLSLSKQEKADIEKHEQALKEKQACVDALTRQQEALLEECEKTAKQLDKLPWQDVIAPVAGKEATAEELVARVMACFKAQGFVMNENDARALLITLALSDEGTLSIAASNQSDAATAAQALAQALGSSCNRIYAADLPIHPVRVLNGGDAPVFTCDTESLPRPIPNATHIVLCDGQVNPLSGENALCDQYFTDPWLCFDVETDDRLLPSAMPAYPAVSTLAIRRAMLQEGELSDAVRQSLLTLCDAVKQAGAALPLVLKDKLVKFILAGQNCMKGGIAAALDYATRCIVLPHVQAYMLEKDAVRPALQAMPETLKVLEE